MRSKKPIAAVLAALATFGIAACGSGGAGSQANSTANKLQTQASKQLSPQAGQLLQSTQSLAASVIATGKDYVNARITQKQAVNSLNAAERRAQTLAKRASRLPSTSRARNQLQTLNGQVQSSASALRKQIQSGKLNGQAKVASQLSQLQSSATQAFNQLESGLPKSTRNQIQGTLQKIKSLTG